jgi:serine phosphatase RsbU (regulator of sigma subunit)
VLSLASIFAPPRGQEQVTSPAPARILSASTMDELRAVLGEVLHDTYAQLARFELFVLDGGAPTPTVNATEAQDRLASIASPLIARQRLRTDAGVRVRAVMTAPVTDPAGALAAVLLVQGEPRRPDFTRVELAALEAIAALVSVALARLRVGDSPRARARAALDRTTAGRVQRGLMNSSLPADIGVTATAEYLPAFEVGGDFYSIKHVGPGVVGVAIGDVSGNGVSAALVMSRVAAEIETALDAGEAPSAILGRINKRLADADGDMFVTAACLLLDTATRRMWIANAGHLPLLVRRTDGEVFACAGASGLPLGMFPGEYFEEELTLEPDDIVLLMTDGLLEALDHPTGHRGLQLLTGELRAVDHDPAAVTARIRQVVEAARLTHELDDVTWVTLQVA